MTPSAILALRRLRAAVLRRSWKISPEYFECFALHFAQRWPETVGTEHFTQTMVPTPAWTQAFSHVVRKSRTRRVKTKLSAVFPMAQAASRRIDRTRHDYFAAFTVLRGSRLKTDRALGPGPLGSRASRLAPKLDACYLSEADCFAFLFGTAFSRAATSVCASGGMVAFL